MVKTAYFKTDDHLIAIAEDILSSGRSRKMRGPFMDEFEKFSNIYGSELYNLFSKYPDKFQITGSNFNDAKIKLIKKSYFVLPPVVEKVLNNIHTAPDEFVTHESPIFSGIPPEQVMASLLYLFLKKEIFMVGDSSLPENERIRFVYSTKEDRMREYAFLLGKKTIIYKYPDEGYAKNLYNWTNEITVRRNINAFLYFMPYQEGCLLSQTPIAPQNTPISSPTPNNSRPQNTPTSNNQQSFTVQNVPFEVLIGFSQTIVDEAGGLSQVLLGECMNIYFGFNSTMYNDLIKKLLDTPYFELRSGFIFSTKPYPLPPYYLNIYNQIFDFPTKSYKIGGNDFPIHRMRNTLFCSFS